MQRETGGEEKNLFYKTLSRSIHEKLQERVTRSNRHATPEVCDVFTGGKDQELYLRSLLPSRYSPWQASKGEGQSSGES